jgi:hypothetical protein
MPQGKILFGLFICGWKDNIKKYLRGIRCEDVD